MTAWGYVFGYGAAVLVGVCWIAGIIWVVRQPDEHWLVQAERARIDHEFFAITAGLADQLTIEENGDLS